MENSLLLPATRGSAASSVSFFSSPFTRSNQACSFQYDASELAFRLGTSRRAVSKEAERWRERQRGKTPKDPAEPTLNLRKLSVANACAAFPASCLPTPGQWRSRVRCFKPGRMRRRTSSPHKGYEGGPLHPRRTTTYASDALADRPRFLRVGREIKHCSRSHREHCFLVLRWSTLRMPSPSVYCGDSRSGVSFRLLKVVRSRLAI